jgi:hypothetical protein
MLSREEEGVLGFLRDEAARRGMRLNTIRIVKEGRRHPDWDVFYQLVLEVSAAFPSYFPDQLAHFIMHRLPEPHPLLARGFVPVPMYSPDTRVEYGFMDLWTDTLHHPSTGWEQSHAPSSPRSLLRLLQQ